MEYQVTQFGGFSKDVRDNSRETCAYVENFDIFKRPFSMTPQLSTETAAAYAIKRVTKKSSSAFYGLEDNTNVVRIRTASSVTGNWDSVAEAGTYGFKSEMFVYYEPTDSLYYFSASGGTTYLSQYVVGTDSLTENKQSHGAPTTLTDAFVNPNDGNIYYATDEQLHRINQSGTISTDIAPSIPSNYQITSIDSYGVYLVVGCQDKDIAKRSLVYLVDVDITNPAPVDVIDFGEGQLKIVGSIGGRIWGIIDRASNTDFINKQRIIIRSWSGGDEATMEWDLYGTLSSNSLLNQKAINNNQLYFSANLQNSDRSGGDIEGIWSIGQNLAGSYVLSLDTIDPNLSTNSIEGFAILGEYRFFGATDDVLRRTNNDSTYATATWISNKIASRRIGRKLDLMQVLVRTEPLPTAGQIKLYYRRDEDTAWTPIITNTTDDSVVSFAEFDNVGTDINIEEGYEYQFKIESLGGAVVTGFYANFDELNEGNYGD